MSRRGGQSWVAVVVAVVVVAVVVRYSQVEAEERR